MKHCGLAILAVCLLTNISFAAPVVYSGYAVSFTRAPGADPTDPANQDMITSDVILTRGPTAGIYNIAQESSFVSNSSPAGTLWAFASNNAGKTIAATNWSDLTFEDWQTALGSVNNLATNILAGSGVVYLVDHDVYLDIRFTEWGQGFGGGGSFSYERAALVPEPASFVLAGAIAVGLVFRRR